MTELAWQVYGKPAPQGSHRGFVNHRTGRVIITQDSKKTMPWREAVKAAALRAIDEEHAGAWETLQGPVHLFAIFQMPRLKSHYGTGRNADVLKDGAPTYCATKPDIDKLLRSSLDAMTDCGVFKDDSQVVMLDVTKQYAATPGAFFRVTPLDQIILPHQQTAPGWRDVETIQVQDVLL